jgi:hypothetical protein
MTTTAPDRTVDTLPRRLQVGDYQAIAVTLAAFTAMVIGTWQRWATPFVDHGREMNLPARLLAGDVLYVDITYQYGPFAPHFNSLLYAAFGVHLMTLHVAALVCATAILVLCYFLARRMLATWESCATALLIVVLCALAGPSGNFIQPYAFAALYGWMFSLGALWCGVRFLDARRPASMLWAGCWVGLAVACKPEFGLQAGAPVACAWLLSWSLDRRLRWPAAAVLATSTAGVIALMYATTVSSVPWSLLVTDIYIRFTEPQMLHFSRVLSGVHQWPRTGWAVVAAVGDLFVVAAATALVGLVFSPKRGPRELGRAWRISALLGLGLVLAAFRVRAPGLDNHLLRSAPVVLSITIFGLTARIVRGRLRDHEVGSVHVLLLTAVFAALAILRVPLNISLVWAYAPFTLPALLLVYASLLLRTFPEWLLSSAATRRLARQSVVALMLVIAGTLGVVKVLAARSRNVVEIASDRGRFFTSTSLGVPLRDALAFVDARTAPGDYVASVPQGSMINFLTGRPNPLREENIVPGFLTADWEAAAIDQMRARRVSVVLVANVLTPEYRDTAFGVDYNRRLLEWIQANYREVATFGPPSERPLKLGDSTFFIRAFERAW